MKTIQWRLVLIGLILGLSACNTTPQAASTPAPTPAATLAPTRSAPTAAAPQGAAPAGPEPLIASAPESVGICETAPLPELPVRPGDETDWGKGASAAEAQYTIIEYSDFQCPGCAGMAPVMDFFLQQNPNFRLVYRHFPLGFHPLAQVTAEAAEAAGAQGKFWEMHDLLFNSVQEWAALTEADARTKMGEYAATLALDVTRFNRELADGTYTAKVQAQYAEALALELPGTPSFIFDNILLPSDIGLSYQSLASFSELVANKDTLFFAVPPETTVAAADEYLATLKTSQGDIVVELLPESAPVHVNSFVFLAEQHWYDGSDFFFVQDDFVAVTGDPTNSTIGYPGYYCYGEERDFSEQTGLVWMMGNGQFLITLGETAYQNLVVTPQAQGGQPAQFALIGQVTQGLEVLDKLAIHSPVESTAPADTLETITLARP